MHPPLGTPSPSSACRLSGLPRSWSAVRIHRQRPTPSPDSPSDLSHHEGQEAHEGAEKSSSTLASAGARCPPRVSMLHALHGATSCGLIIMGSRVSQTDAQPGHRLDRRQLQPVPMHGTVQTTSRARARFWTSPKFYD